MSIEKIINELKSLKIILKINGDKIDVEAPKGVLNREIINKISKNKNEILEYWNSKKTENNYSSIKPTKEKDYYVLSSAQKRLYLLWQMEPDSTVYNMPAFFELEGNLNVKKFNSIFNKIIARHESLRTSFHMEDELPIQRIKNTIDFNAPYYDLSKTLNENDELLDSTEGIVKDFIKPFDLNESPLFRVGLIKVSSGRHIFMFDMHHIISDGTSVSNLIKEFTSLYSGNELPELKIQYKDYAEWQQNEEQQKLIKNQENKIYNIIDII